jgi:hypothetical protein
VYIGSMGRSWVGNGWIKGTWPGSCW